MRRVPSVPVLSHPGVLEGLADGQRGRDDMGSAREEVDRLAPKPASSSVTTAVGGYHQLQSATLS